MDDDLIAINHQLGIQSQLLHQKLNIAEQGLNQISDTKELEKIITEIIADHPTQTQEYKAGKEKLFGFFVGQAMKATQGKANPEILNAILKKMLQ